MCFGGSPKIDMPPAPAVASTESTKSSAAEMAPQPSATPVEVSSQQTAESRRKKLAAMRYGMISTIKTSPQGIPKSGASMSPATDTKKNTLGS